MKKIFIILLGLLVTAPFSSCDNEEFFELKNPFNPPILSVSDLDNSVAGVYYALTGTGGNGDSFGNLMGFQNSVADEGLFVALAGGAGAIQEFYDRNNTNESGWLNTVWSVAYNTISNANYYMDVANSGVLENDEFKAEIPRLNGELLFLRAYSYWMLVKAFCPPYDPQAANDLAVLPLRLEPLQGISDANNFPASPTADVYASIISDLEAAFLDLPKDFNEVNNNFKENYQYGRVNKFAAAAMLARVYFQMGNSAKALEYCNYVIDQNEGRYDLSEDPIEVWDESIYASSKDGIWYYAVGDGPRVNGLGGNSSNWKAPRRFAHWNYQIPGFPSGSGTVSGIGPNNRTLAFSRSLLNQVGWVDGSLNATDVALRDKRYSQLVQRVAAGADPTFPSVNEVHYWNNKYYRAPNANRRIGGIPLLRYAEVVLTRAILRFNANNLQGAADDLNMVRRRAWNEAVAGEPYTDLLSNQITANLIHTERMIEMAFEGDRIHYLQALKQPIPAGDRPGGAIPYNDPSLRWPIPVREKELNQGIGN